MAWMALVGCKERRMFIFSSFRTGRTGRTGPGKPPCSWESLFLFVLFFHKCGAETTRETSSREAHRKSGDSNEGELAMLPDDVGQRPERQRQGDRRATPEAHRADQRSSRRHEGGEGEDVLGGVLTELANYTVYHFGAEEKLLQALGYPAYGSHKKEHETFTKEVLDLKIRCDRGDLILTINVMAFLKEWLTSHILKTDKNYSPFLNGKGVF